MMRGMLISLGALLTLAGAAPAMAGAGFVGLSVTHMTPPPQPPLEVIMGRDLTAVRELFNREADRPRIFVLVSPT